MSRNVHEHKINISELRVIMNYIGIDLGTSAVKLLLMEGSGKILKIVSREYPICFPKPGWSEQNPYDWFTQSMDGLKELLDGTDRSLVAGISFGGQMHGLVALDDKDEVIRPAHSLRAETQACLSWFQEALSTCFAVSQRKPSTPYSLTHSESQVER